jgi:hypothetical protein
MSNRGVEATGNAFVGGAQQRNLAPPGVGGGIASANTRVSAPVSGVNPGQIKSARQNQGSNIGIPYSRLVPLNNSNKLISQDELGKTVARRETEDLQKYVFGENTPPLELRHYFNSHLNLINLW